MLDGGHHVRLWHMKMIDYFELRRLYRVMLIKIEAVMLQGCLINGIGGGVHRPIFLLQPLDVYNSMRNTFFNRFTTGLYRLIRYR